MLIKTHMIETHKIETHMIETHMCADTERHASTVDVWLTQMCLCQFSTLHLQRCTHDTVLMGILYVSSLCNV